MFKKLLLCFSLVAIQNQIIKSSECFDEGFTQRCDNSLWQQAVATFKSDLCLCKPEKVVQHNTFASQVAAGARFACYGRLFMLLGDLIINRSVPIGVLLSYPSMEEFVEGCLLAPISEECLFTWLPVGLARMLEVLTKSNMEFIHVCAAIEFGLCHSKYCTSAQIALMVNKYCHNRYYKKRPLNLSTIYGHGFYNFMVYSLPIKFV